MRQFGHKQTLHVFSLSGDVGSGKHSKPSNLNYNATTQGPDENVVVLICQSCCKDFSYVLNVFVKIYTWISLGCYMDLLEL